VEEMAAGVAAGFERWADGRRPCDG
jgi:hypothetical protein